MMIREYKGAERRQFTRLEYNKPLACKVCKKETVSKLLQGYTTDVSEGGQLCNIKDKVKKGDILWLSFDRSTLNICEQIDKRSLIYQNGVIGKVVRIGPKKQSSYDIGVQFITREEKNMTNIFPKVHFLKDKFQQEDGQDSQEEETDEEA